MADKPQPPPAVSDEAIAAAADANGMIAVEARQPLMDNGRRYPAGAALHMHRDLIAAHVATGQVKLAESPADKQVKTTPVQK